MCHLPKVLWLGSCLSINAPHVLRCIPPSLQTEPRFCSGTECPWLHRLSPSPRGKHPLWLVGQSGNSISSAVTGRDLNMGLGPGHWDWGKAGSGERAEGAQRKAFLPNKKERCKGENAAPPFWMLLSSEVGPPGATLWLWNVINERGMAEREAMSLNPGACILLHERSGSPLFKLFQARSRGLQLNASCRCHVRPACRTSPDGRETFSDIATWSLH